MPFTLIKGRYKPLVGIPDGDSVRFLADDLRLWSRLEGKPVKLGTGANTKNTAQLRFEGIDAIEKGATQPLATEARESMFKLIGFDENNNPEPTGYILARMTDDESGRPICFVFAGTTGRADGSEVYLEPSLLRQSVNYRQIKSGFAYPLYYNTLFASLRNEFNQALAFAKQRPFGYWPKDKTLKGVIVKNNSDLVTIPPIWPKLWRRMDQYLKKNNSLSGFIKFLEDRNERVDILSTMEEQGLQDLVKVTGNKVKMTQRPENLRVVAKAGKRIR